MEVAKIAFMIALSETYVANTIATLKHECNISKILVCYFMIVMEMCLAVCLVPPEVEDVVYWLLPT